MMLSDFGDDDLFEKWSAKYKRSINCANPRGFSQRAHCQGRKKNEAVQPQPVPATATPIVAAPPPKTIDQLQREKAKLDQIINLKTKILPQLIARAERTRTGIPRGLAADIELDYPTPTTEQELDQYLMLLQKQQKLLTDFVARQRNLYREDSKQDSNQHHDEILVKLIEMVINGQQVDSDYYGMVAACVIGPDGQEVCRLNYRLGDDDRVHAERAAIDAYEHEHGEVGADCTVITTLSPCCNPMKDRVGMSCSDLLASKGIKQIYAGYRDPTQQSELDVEITSNKKIQQACKKLADTFLKPNTLKENKNNQFIRQHIGWVADQLGIEKLPDIVLLDQPKTTSFGQYGDGKIYLVTKDRHPVDVLRTLAHELTHYRQDLEGDLTPGAGETGTPQENEANSEAGIVMRDFNQKNPEYLGLNEQLEDTPPEVMQALDQAAQKSGYKNWQDVLTNPKSNSARVQVAKLATTILKLKSGYQPKKTFEDFTGRAKPGSMPGSLRRKAGKKAGEKITPADLLRLQGHANRMKQSNNKATRDRGIQLARQVSWYKNFHKKKSEAVGNE